MTQPPDDPLAQLEKWGRAVERRVSRRHRLRRWRFRARPRVPRRAVVITLCVLIAAAVVASNVWWIRRPNSPDSYAKAPVPSGVAATSGPGAADAGPFAGTPAAEFPSGEDGLVMPAAQAVGAWSQGEVADALAKVKAALVASHLDRRMLVDHDPSVFLAMLSLGNRDRLAREIPSGYHRITAVHIAKEATLADVPPRVSGRTTYRDSLWGTLPVLEVITNYVWVYPFQVPQSWAGERVAVVHSEEHWVFPKDSSAVPGNRGMTLTETDGYWSNMDCAQAKAGFTAPFRGVARPSSHQASGPASRPEDPDAYFQPDHSLDIGPGCG